MAYAHGYQVSPRTELREPWFPDRSLLARCPNLLAVSSTGAAYDVVDVDACTEMGILVVTQSGTNKEAVAGHALGMMLCVSARAEGVAVGREVGGPCRRRVKTQ